MMASWLHALQQFQFSIVHRPGRDYGNTDGLSKVPVSPCGQCTRQDCPHADLVTESIDQPFDSESTGSLEDSDWLQFPVIPSRYLRYRKKIQSASRSGRGLRQVTSHRGPRSRV